MTIVVMCGPEENGAYAPLSYVKPGRSPIYVRKFAEGATVSMREMNGYDDSDFYATYYDAESDSFKEVMYGTTRGWTYAAGAVIDATPEVRAKYDAMLEAERVVANALRAAREAALPKPGRTVKVVAKRGKVGKFNGKVGKVFWYGVDKFRPNYYGGPPAMRAGVEFEDGEKVFSAAGSFEVVFA